MGHFRAAAEFVATRAVASRSGAASSAVSSPISIVADLLLLAASAFLFAYLALQVGRLVRPVAPEPEKLRPYECGEPAIGSSDVQFDLRFYVVAIVFLVFEVEVAFFFPWAVAYGKLCRPGESPSVEPADGSLGDARDRAAGASLGGRAVEARSVAVCTAGSADRRSARWEPVATRRALALAAIVDMAVFFAVLLVGYG